MQELLHGILVEHCTDYVPLVVQVDDMVNSNSILYSSGEHPDHVVVIKYVPYVADSKRAMDEYTSEIFMGGRNTIALHNTCEDSLLAAPIILDLVILTELLTRIQARLGMYPDVFPCGCLHEGMGSAAPGATQGR